jgi:N-acetylmuramoyl-L-alanine amidase
MGDLDSRGSTLNAPRRRLAAVTLSCLTLAIFSGGLSSQMALPTPLTMLSKDGRRTIPVTVVAEQECVALDDLATVFQLAVHDDAAGAVTITYKGRTIVLTQDQALASVTGRLVPLPTAPSRAGRHWLVPVEFLSRALAPVYDTPLDLRKSSHLLVVGPLRVPRVTVRYEPTAPGGRLTIDATPRATSTVTQEAERILIKFDADALDVASPPLAPVGGQSLVQAVRLMDPITLVVDVGTRMPGFRATAQPVAATTRLTIDLMAPEAAAMAPASQAPAPATPADVPPTPTQPSARVRTIAIDPGHGGSDGGVTGSGGTKEKDLTLAIARRARGALEARLGVRVVLTRDDDRDVTLDDRASIANNNKADLFISLHANASFRPSAAGASVYYATDTPPAAVTGGTTGAARAQALGGGTRDIELVDWSRAQSRYLDQSMGLAGMLVEQFRDHVPLAARAVDKAPLAVLASANMPAVLVEMGVLSNGEQERALAGDELPLALVQAISDAVVRFRDTSDPAGR